MGEKKKKEFELFTLEQILREQCLRYLFRREPIFANGWKNSKNPKN